MSRKPQDILSSIREAAKQAEDLDLMGLNLEFAEEGEEQEGEVIHDDGETHVEGDVGSALEAGNDVETPDEEAPAADMSGTELENFEAAEIEDLEVLTAEQVRSIVESILFSTDKPLSIGLIKQAFKGTQVKSKDIREALHALTEEYAQLHRGFTLNEVSGAFQLRSKPENMKYLRQSVKARPFKLSGPALETLSIVAYKQPVTKHQIDEIRGVESGHLLRALMEKHLITFGERSDLPGKPMFYETTRKFLEVFGLRNLQELPSLAEIDQLIPEGIGEIEDKETLSDLTGKLSQEIGTSYSEGEDELLKITDELSQITTSSEFFEQEKIRMREKRDADRAQNLREALTVGEAVDEKDLKWLERYEAGLVQADAASAEAEFVAEVLAEPAPSEEATAEAVESTTATPAPGEEPPIG